MDLTALTIPQLIDALEKTDIITAPAVRAQRTRVMDEIQARDPEKFLAWLESDWDNPNEYTALRKIFGIE